MGTIFQRSERGGAGGKWYGEYTDHTGERVRKSTGTSNRKVAEQIMHQWEIDVARRINGLIDPAAELAKTHRDKPLTEHFEKFIASIEAKKRSAKYLGDTRREWNKVVASLGWTSLADISAESLDRFIIDLTTKSDDKPGRSQRTVARHLQTVKAFVRWCMTNGRMQSDPLRTISNPNPETDRRLRRRYLLPDEWPWLIKSITTTRNGVPPSERKFLYEIAIQSGLRLNELRSLIVANCKLTEESPHLVVMGTDTKNRKTARQILTRDLATRFAAHLAEHKRSGSAAAFVVPTIFKAAGMVREDLLAARENWIKDANTDDEREKRSQSDFLNPVNHSGEAFDFHSFRHTCGAWLAIKSVPPKTIQSIMRHSTIRLTLDTYGHLMPGSEADAIEQLGQLFRGQ
jgi:integrase